MKKFLSIKNSQGIYVARASFSSDETVIDFINQTNSNNSDNCNPKPVSIIVTPDQLPSSSTTPLNIQPITIEASNSEYTHIERIESIPIADNSLVYAKTANKNKNKKRFSKILRALHLKKSSSKMNEKSNETDSKRSSELEFTIDETNQEATVSTPSKSFRKGKTAALVKKFSLTPKKSTSKKSSIPLRTATSAEQISHPIQTIPKHSKDVIDFGASTSHYSMSEMNLVNIDYHQESTSNELDVGVKFGQTHYRNNRIGDNNNIASGDDGNLSNFNRGWNTSSNLSIRSGISTMNNNNNKIGSGSADNSNTSTEKLQITISGKKRATESIGDLQQQQQQQHQHRPNALTEFQRRKFERKALTVQHQPKKLNISHDLTLMNTIGVPPTTQAPSIPSYRITSGSIKNVVQSKTGIKTQTTMQSQQTFDISSSTVNVEKNTSNPITKSNATDLLTVTSFDADETDEIASAQSPSTILSGDEKNTSLLTEIIEAERRNSMTNLSERGRRYPGVAASETIKFSHQSSDSSNSNIKNDDSNIDEIIADKSDAIAVKMIEDDQQASTSSAILSSDKHSENSDSNGKKSENIDEIEKNVENELMHTLTQSNGAKLLHPNADDAIEANEIIIQPSTSTSVEPTIRFEVGKQVRPIFTSNQNLHHTTYSAHDNDPTTTYTSIISSNSSSFIDTHNDSVAHSNVNSAEQVSTFDLNDKKLSTENHELQHQQNQPQKKRIRRRIAYLESTVDGNKK